ncbi:hypothetical protein HZB03_02415 [Candidatus Woesearchaeota archaeon]|nr:hypothetical protein [Candidatus Woesearchaeota archaeon]
MAFVEVATTVGLYVWELFKIWLSTLFVAPFKKFDMLWVLVPVWLTWVFTEFFQEKKGTSLGNAISNAVTPFWASLDWTRTSIRFFHTGELSLGSLIGRIALSLIVLSYGMTIIVLGIKGNKIVRYIGRIREVTYLIAVFTPVFYNVVPLSFKLVLAIIVFFPLFYFTIELIDYFTPEPKAMKTDESDEGGLKKEESGLGDLSSGLGGLGEFGDNAGRLGGVGPESQLPTPGSSGGMPPSKGPDKGFRGGLGKF